MCFLKLQGQLVQGSEAPSLRHAVGRLDLGFELRTVLSTKPMLSPLCHIPIFPWEQVGRTPSPRTQWGGELAEWGEGWLWWGSLLSPLPGPECLQSRAVWAAFDAMSWGWAQGLGKRGQKCVRELACTQLGTHFPRLSGWCLSIFEDPGQLRPHSPSCPAFPIPVDFHHCPWIRDLTYPAHQLRTEACLTACFPCDS